MTTTLTFDSAASRVRISADALPGADYATVERSTDQVVWTTVRGGTQVPLTGGSMVLPNVTTAYASTPDNAALRITGDIDIRCDVRLDSWNNGHIQSLVAKWDGVLGNLAYRLSIDGIGKIDLAWQIGPSTATFANAPSTVAPTPNATTGRLAVRATLKVNNGASGNTVTFYTAPTIAGPWTQLGATVVGAVTSIASTTANLYVGPNPFDALTGPGTFHAAEVRNGIDGTVVAAPDFKYQPAGTTSFTDGAGRVWTLAGSAAISIRQFVAQLDDYEFAPGVTNYYRVRSIDAAATAFVAAGTAATGNNTSVVPPLPTGIVVGDLLVILASIRNSGAGTVNVPAGWTVMRAFGNVSLLGRRYQAGDVAPTVTFTGGVAGADTIAQMAAFRRTELAPFAGSDQLNASAQNIAIPALIIPQPNYVLLIAGWKQNAWTSVATISGLEEIGEPTSTAGSGAGQVWDQGVQFGGPFDVPSTTVFTVTGGVAAISRAAVVVLQHVAYLLEQTANVSPTLGAVWLKSPIAPALNQVITLGGDGFMVDRSARGGVFDVVGRALPVAVTDIRGSRRYTLLIRTRTAPEALAIGNLLNPGNVLFLHAPTGQVVPAGGVYVRVGDTQEQRPLGFDEMRAWIVPVVEVAAPGPDVVGP